MDTLLNQLRAAVNCHCAENGSNTPDYILAQFFVDCLAVWDKACVERDRWYGITCAPGVGVTATSTGHVAQQTHTATPAPVEGGESGSAQQ